MADVCAKHGCGSYTAENAEDASNLAAVNEYNCVVVGPEEISIIAALRRKINAKTAIIAISDDNQARVAAINAGAVDCWFTAISPDEAIARLERVYQNNNDASSTFKFGPFVIDYDQKAVEHNGVRIPLTGKEYQMLEFMCRKPGTTLTNEMFLNLLYGDQDKPEPKIIDVLIKNLCRRLFRAGGANYIETVVGKGYKLNPTPAAAAPPGIAPR